MFFGRKLASAALLLFGVSFVAFGSLKLLPGDPAQILPGSFADDSSIDAIRRDLKLDLPFIVQYADYVGGALHGDLGQSYQNRRPVASLLARPLRLSAKLMGLSQAFALGLAIPLGLWLGYRQGSLPDRLVTGLLVGLGSVPGFVLGSVLSVLLTYKLRLFPTIYPTGATSISQEMRALILPVLTLALGQVPIYVRLLRNDVISTLSEDFILSARARGLGVRKVLLHHVLRPSSSSLASLAGINVSFLLGGAIIIERVFAIPGIGFTLIAATSQRDYMVVIGIVLILGASVVVANFASEILQWVIDPRVRPTR
jgi:peptide/nickel transport system permease protein